MLIFLLGLMVVALWVIFLLWREVGSRGYNQEKFLDLILSILVSSVLGARLFYLILVPNHSTLLSLPVNLPGFLYFGGVGVGLAVFYFFVRRYAWDFYELGDIIAPGLLLIQSLLPLRCFFEDCQRDSFYAEMGFLLLIAYLLLNYHRLIPQFRPRKGVLWYAYIMLLPSFYLLLDFIEPSFNEWDRWFAFALLLVAMLGFLRYLRNLQSTPQEDLRLELTFKSRLRRRPLTMKNLPSVNFSLPQQFIKQIRYKLLHQKKELEEELKLIEQEDPFKDTERTENNAEMVSEAAELSGHLFIDMQIKFLRKTLKGVQNALLRIKEGTYGLSVKSGKPIPQERLEAVPLAELTVEEEKEREKAEATKLPPMERIN